jgi:beta-glucosidase
MGMKPGAGVLSHVAPHGAPHVAPVALRGIPSAALRLPVALRGIPSAALRLSVLCVVALGSSVRVVGADASAAAGAATPVAAHSWDDARLSPERRAALLNRELTLDERITMVHGPMALPINKTLPPPEAILAAGYIPGVPRLGIPALYESDASLGVTNPLRVRGDDGATALPSGLALAATFNPTLAYAGGAMIGSEARAKGFNVLLAGGVNLTREPRNGRNFEYLGEDPLLAGTLAGESIRGIQSNHIISTTKHFALNEQETGRHAVNELIDEGALRESDLLAFELAIEKGRPGAVMCAYNRVNGSYACGNEFLLDHVLKRDWRFPGWVMSDWGAVYATDFAAQGLDQESGEQLDRQVWFGAPLREAVQSGAVPAARLEDMTRRILQSMFANGLFDYPSQRSIIDYAAHAQIARQEASEGIVLLRNRAGALPLAPSVQHILVVGGHADAGTLSGGGSSEVFPPHIDPRAVIPLGGGGEMAAWKTMVFQSSPPLTALRARAPEASVTFDDGRYPAAAAALAKQADVVIVFANQWTTESEDVPDLSLPAGQDELIAAVAAANTHTIVVLENGGPVYMPWLDRTAAVVEAWYPGAGGADAIADVLFGVINPSGRLPITFPASAEQLPVAQLPGFGLPPMQPFEAPHPRGAAVGYRWMATHDQTPLFPFGFGLSYTHFGYSGLQVTAGKTVSVSFSVRNEGDRAGEEAAQVYLSSAARRRVKRLIGFSKVELAPGEEKRVTVSVDSRLIADFDVARQRWRVAPGKYHVEVGGSSTDVKLESDAAVRGEWMKP